MTDAANSSYPLDRKVGYLRRPDSYPERPSHVDALETHMSWVFITDRHAYKLKKPVRHDFLDFSTLEARRRCCEEELRLNRRLAPDVYLDVVPLTADASGRLALAGDGMPVEWLVRMRRLPRERMLDAALARGGVSDEQVSAVADVLAAFYRRLAPDALTATELCGRLVRDVEACRTELRSPVHMLPSALFEGTAERLIAFVGREPELFGARAAAGRIVEGHGDLRPEHVCLVEPPVVIDCLEFNRSFRVLDVADELAYLAMECARLGAPATGEAIFAACCERLRDSVAPRLFHFYSGFRALVRARIAAWHTIDVPAAGIEKWRARARQYLALAATSVQAFG